MSRTWCSPTGGPTHGTLAELTWNIFRDHLVLMHEIPKHDPDLGNPDLFVPLEWAAADAEIVALMGCFSGRSGGRWSSPAPSRR